MTSRTKNNISFIDIFSDGQHSNYGKSVVNHYNFFSDYKLNFGKCIDQDHIISWNKLAEVTSLSFSV